MESSSPQWIDRQYRVLKKLGEGLSGEVFQVKRENEEWALKLLKLAPEAADPESWIDAFKFEFSLLKDIQHPNVVAIGDFGWDSELNRLYYTQEFLRGRPLNVFLDGETFEKAEALFLQCLEGLEAIHDAPALHGDLKPSNIFVVATPKGPRAKILDLGMAHPRLRSGSGTPAYMAPEKVLNDAVDGRSDLYSLGVGFYEALTGTNPFLKENASESLKAQTTVVPAPAGSLNPKIPPYFNRILMQLLAKNPRDRPASARAVLAELSHTAGEAPVVSERWVGRDEAIEAVRSWGRELKGFSIFAVTGEKGTGKTRLLQEMKYDLELNGVAVQALSSAKDFHPRRTDDVLLMDSPSLPDLASLKTSARGLLIAVAKKNLASLEEEARRLKIPFTAQVLRGFLPEEIRTLICLSSHDENPPLTLAMAIFEETQGNPARTVHLLSALCRQKKLLDEEGRWNLSVFREGGMDLDAVLSDEPVADEELRSIGDDRPDERAALLLRKVRDALRSGETDRMTELFAETERVVKLIEDREKRLRRRAELFERKAWAAILLGEIHESQGEIEAAKTLLEESAVSDPALELRLLNFEAFGRMRTGKIDEAIALFEETHRRWAKELSREEKARVVNNDLAAALMQKGRFSEAIEIQKEYLKFFDEQNDAAQSLRAHYHLGECYLQTSSLKKAAEHYHAVATAARKLKKWDMLLRAYNGLGNALNLLHKPHESIEYYRRALDLARYLKDFPAAAAVAQNIGAIHKDLGRGEPAKEHLEMSLKLISLVKEPTPYGLSLRLRATLELGELARERADFGAAHDLLTEARRLIETEKGLETFSFFVYQALATLALDQTRFDEFAALYPDLLYHAKTKEQKERVEFLKNRSPVDPSQPRQTVEPAPVLKAPAPSGNADGDWLRALLKINQSLIAEKDPERLLTFILSTALDLSSAESGLVLLADEAGRLSVATSLNIVVDEDLSQISRGIAERVLREGRALKVDNASEDGDFKSYRSVILLGLKSIFCAPIVAQGKVVGVLYLIHRFRPSLFGERTEMVLQAFADQAGLALQNALFIATIERKKETLEDELKDAEEKIGSYETLLREGGTLAREKYPHIIAQSPAMEKVFHLLDRITASNLSVLIHGESGTGKELIARALHQNGPRKAGKFVAINCGALPANLIESELFGYKAGAFTDARTDKKGLLEEASGGTVFLDEIGDLELSLQVKLLRALQEREIVRLGDATPIPIDVRIASATHQDIGQRISEGRFREDLFYRIAEIQIEIPPLRDRKEDIPAMVDHFAKRFAEEQGLKKAPKVSRELMKVFLTYPWPGNVRELSNRVRVGAALSNGKTIELADFPENDRRALAMTGVSQAYSKAAPMATQRPAPASSAPSFFKDLLDRGRSWREIETILMAKALIRFDFDVPNAARSLDIGQATLYSRLRREKFRRRREEFEPLAFQYLPETTLENLRRQVFSLAYEKNDGKPYHAARQLKVSPGMFYRWAPQKSH